MDFKSIGERIKHLRLKNNFTLEELGQKINVSKQTLYKYENGIITNIPSDKIEDLAEIYEVSPAYLMGWETKNSPLPTLTAKDEHNIQKKLENILEGLTPDAGLAYYNDEEPMDDEDKELLRISLENTLRLAKQMAKQKFTPKKYRKE